MCQVLEYTAKSTCMYLVKSWLMQRNRFCKKEFAAYIMNVLNVCYVITIAVSSYPVHGKSALPHSPPPPQFIMIYST
jgi:hypothetical protein